MAQRIPSAGIARLALDGQGVWGVYSISGRSKSALSPEVVIALRRALSFNRDRVTRRQSRRSGSSAARTTALYI
jgi:hypothetical protein